MSRTSSDSRFRRPFALVVAGLLAASVGLGAAVWLQGPKLADASIDAAAAVQYPSSLRMFANGPITEVADEQVEIAPAAAVRVSTDDRVLTLSFAEPLRAGTEYTVTVAGVRGAGSGESVFEHSFTTPALAFSYLRRGEDTDRILSTSVGADETAELYTADRIQTFAPVGGALAVVELADDGTSVLRTVAADGNAQAVNLPEPGRIEALAGVTEGSTLVFSFTSATEPPGRAYESHVFTLDLAGDRVVTPVLGLDGQPLQAPRWLRMPRSDLLIAQQRDQTVVVVDLATGTVGPLGEFAELGRLALDGESLEVEDLLGPMRLDLESGDRVRTELSLVDGVELVDGGSQELWNGSRVHQTLRYLAEDNRFESLVVLDDGSEGRALYEPAGEAGVVLDVSVSPNGQYAAVLVVPDIEASVTDGYAIDPQSTTVTTVLVDIGTASVVQSFVGFGIVWE